jgi:hypothetical protein
MRFVSSCAFDTKLSRALSKWVPLISLARALSFSFSCHARARALSSVRRTQCLRVNKQALVVFNYLRIVDEHHFSVGAVGRGWDVDECAAETARQSAFDVAPSTVLTWARDFVSNDCKFSSDDRGTHHRPSAAVYITENADHLLRLKRWIRGNLANLSVSSVATFINEELFEDLTDVEYCTYINPVARGDLDEAAWEAKCVGKKKPLANSTVWAVMVDEKVGCKFSSHKATFYTDNHEQPANITYRVERYLPRETAHELRQYHWIQLDPARAATISAKYGVVGTNVSRLPVALGEDYGAVENAVEFFVHDSEIFDGWINGDSSSPFADVAISQFGGNLSWRMPPGSMPILKFGQDESCFKAFTLPSVEWWIDGNGTLRPKNDGPSDMVSAFTSTVDDFGLPLTHADLVAINANRLGTQYRSAESAVAAAKGHNSRNAADARVPETADKHPLPFVPWYVRDDGEQMYLSPGVLIFQVGKNRDGYFDSDRFLVQVEDFVDCFEHKFPGHVLLLEVDWSSGHGKNKPDGLNVNNMNVNVGGKNAAVMHDTVVAASDLGVFSTTITLPNDRAVWGDRAGTVVDYALPESGVQLMNFPQWSPDAESPSPRPLPPFFQKTMPYFSYCGQPKGMKQVLFERGLFCDEKWTDPQTKRTGAFMTEKGHKRDGIIVPETSMKCALSSCIDFIDEKTLLEQLLEDLGHILEKSPKCHPELAGVGIEYCWGKSKYNYRRINRGTQVEMCREQRKRVLASMSPDVLPKRRLRKFDRKCYEYKKAYAEIATDGAKSFAHVEEIKKKYKTHRTITMAVMTSLATPTKA